MVPAGVVEPARTRLPIGLLQFRLGVVVLFLLVLVMLLLSLLFLLTFDDDDEDVRDEDDVLLLSLETGETVGTLSPVDRPFVTQSLVIISDPSSSGLRAVRY